MKKPVTILTCLGLISASSVAFYMPPPSGQHTSDATDRKVEGLGKAGLMSPAQAEAIRRARASAAGRAMEANSTMPGQSMANTPAQPGAQTPPPGAPNSPGATPPPAAPAPLPPPPPALPKWRLEGTTIGGHCAPSAVFAIDGWGEILVHPGDKLNERQRVISVHRKDVIVLTDGKKRERISPW
ncbi:MAG: hypothetical protein ACYC96_15490 [Fimbriimonadaceae bacterium]